jgi:DeoR/GlpR family transcriptional regulator of sugar metabolism
MMARQLDGKRQDPLAAGASRPDEGAAAAHGVEDQRPTRAEARRRILLRLRASGRALVRELAAELGVSPVTVHRHLAVLEREGVIARPRGAAQLLDSAFPAASAYAERAASNVAAKEMIARRAVAFLPHVGAAIFVDASTTCLCLAREIARSVSTELTIVTTSPALLDEFASSTVRVIALPGELDQLARVVGGAWTVEFLSALHVQAAFISGIGLTLEAGLTTQRRAIRDVLKEVVARSPLTYMLVDSSKFGRTALLHIAWPWQAAALITDAGLSTEAAAAYTRRGVNLVIAGAPAT